MRSQRPTFRSFIADQLAADEAERARDVATLQRLVAEGAFVLAAPREVRS